MSYRVQRRDTRGRFLPFEWVYVPVEPANEVTKAFHHYVTTSKGDRAL